MAKLSAEQRKIIRQLRFLGRQTRYLQDANATIKQELFAKGFGILMGGIKHINVDKAKADEIGARLLALSHHFFALAVEHKKTKERVKAAAEKSGLKHRQIYDILRKRQANEPRASAHSLKPLMYAMHISPQITIAQNLLKEELKSASRREADILWKYAQQMKRRQTRK